MITQRLSARQCVIDFAKRGLNGFVVLGDGDVPIDLGTVQPGLVAATRENGQNRLGGDGPTPGAAFEQPRQRGARGRLRLGDGAASDDAPFASMPKVTGGIYGLSSKEFMPAMVKPSATSQAASTSQARRAENLPRR